MTNLKKLTKSQLEQMRTAKVEKLDYAKAHPFKTSGATAKAAHTRLVQALENEVAAIDAVLSEGGK